MRAAGFGDFHRLRGGSVGTPVERIAPEPEAAAAFDGPAFAASQIHQRSDGLHAVTWSVTGMHCAACVWVLERLAVAAPGVRSSRVNLGQGSLDVIYDPMLCSPGRQVEVVAKLGYRLRPWVAQAVAAERKAVARDLLLRLAVAAACAVGAMQVSMNLWAGELARDLDPGNRVIFAWTSLTVALPAILWSAWPIHRAAWAALRARRWTVDLAASLAVSLALVGSLIHLAQGGNEVYGDAAAMFIALLLAARWAFYAAQEQVRRLAGQLDGLVPAIARRRIGSTSALIPVEDLAIGDVVEIKPGERLPCDGFVVDHAGRVEAAVLTGEARAERIPVGGDAFAGCTAVDPLVLRVTATGTATRVGRLLCTAPTGPAAHDGNDATAELIRWFMPALIITAIATGLGWWWAAGTERGLTQALAVLVVGCPCAIGLAAPLVTAAWIGRLAARGILVRDAVVLDRLAGIRAVVFDKTGTLSVGRMRVVTWNWTAMSASREELLGAVMAAEAEARHPAGAALSAWAAEQGGHLGVVTAVREFAGAGLSARWGAAELRIGTPSFAGSGHEDGTVISVDGVVLAVVTLADPLRADAPAVVAAARARGWDVYLWSGDRPAAVAAAGAALGLPTESWAAACTPEDKAHRLRALRARGPVAMVGDGVNDAAALAEADVAIALRGGLTAALDHCQVFVADAARGVSAVGDLLVAADHRRQRIRGLLTWAVIYNLIAIGLAAGGAWGPVVCAIAMPISSLLTVIAALMAPRRADQASLSS